MQSNSLPKMLAAASFIASFVIIGSCSKGDDDGGGNADPCAGTSITVSAAATTNPDGCSSNGVVTVTASGSNSFTYKIGNSAFQSSNVFNNLGAGSHTVTVRTSAGCTKTATVNLAAGSAGPLFTAVKAVVQANCAVTGCHTGATPTGNRDFSVDCNIVNAASLIKTKAVDGAGTATQMPPPPMPPLSQADRDKITAWVNAGGQISD